MLIYLDMGFFFTGWLLAQIVFNGFEAHVSIPKRVTKIVILALIFFAIHHFIGRWLFYSVLLLLAVGIAFLHGYWFNFRHGIHWRTAEPRDKYLQLIGNKDKE